MRINRSIYYLLTILCGGIALNSQSQVGVVDVSMITKLKQSVTYYVVDDQTSEYAEPYIKAVKDYWSISEIMVIDSDKADSFMENGAFYLNIGERSQTVIVTSSSTGVISQKDIKIPCITLWSVYDHQRTGKEMSAYKVNQIAYYDLYYDQFQNQYFDLRPGFFGNYVQCMNTMLLAGKPSGPEKDYVNGKELKKLSGAMLHAPKFVLQGVKYNRAESTSDRVKNVASEVFADYPFHYEMVSDENLSNKILEEPTRFYYLVFSIVYPNRYVTVINAQTGAIIYRYISKLKDTASSRSLNKSDLARLAKAIKKEQ